MFPCILFLCLERVAQKVDKGVGVKTLQGYATDTEMFLINPMLEYPGLLVCVLFLPDGIMYRRKIFVSKCKFGRSRTFARIVS